MEAPRLTSKDVVEFVRSFLEPLATTALGLTVDGDLPHLDGVRAAVDAAPSWGPHRYRAHAYRSAAGLCVALRPIPAEIPSPQQLGIPPVLIELARRAQGLVLFTGPAGHGKSTSQASLVDMLNRTSSLHIVTIEDPIEFLHVSQRSIVDQRELATSTHSYADALRHVLRANPDVILVGEVRDPETAAAALTVAETGHLVMSTLHANDAVQAVDRLVDLFPASAHQQIRTQLSMSLLAVVSQRLVRKKEGGRQLAAEILINTTATAKLIRDGKTDQLYSTLELDAASGSQSLNRVLQDQIGRGEILSSELARYAIPRESLR